MEQGEGVVLSKYLKLRLIHFNFVDGTGKIELKHVGGMDLKNLLS